MISTPSNLLCLGRSGTGKTTSSALRLFSTDAFYKYMEEFKVFQKSKAPGKFEVDSNFLDKPSNLRLVFVTASPVLTNEVKKFYNEMKTHFGEQLREARLKKNANKNKEDNKEEDKEEGENIDNADKMTVADSEMAQYLQIESDAFMDDE